MRWSSQGSGVPLGLAVFIASLHLALTLVGAQGFIASVAAGLALYGSGFAARSAARVATGKPFITNPTPADLALDLFLSFGLVAGVSTALALAWSLHAVPLAVAIDGGTLLAGAYALGARRAADTLPEPHAYPASMMGALLVVVGATALFFVWRQTPALPVVNGWDMNTFLVPIEFMRHHGGFSYFLVPPFPSSAGIPYPGMFFHLVAGLSLYLGVGPLEVFWWAPWALLAGYMGLIYALALRFSRRPWLAVIIAFIGAFISGAQAETVRSPLYLTPDMVAQNLFLLLLTWYVYSETRRDARSLCAVLMAGFIGAFYFYALLPTFPFVLAMALGSRRLPFMGSTFRLFVIAYLAMIVALSLLAASGTGKNEGFSQFVDPSLFPLGFKAVVLYHIYSLAFWLPLATMLAAYLPQVRRISREPLSLNYFGVGALALFGAYWLPIWATYRLEFYMRVFVLILLSAYAFRPLDWSKVDLRRRWRAALKMRIVRMISSDAARSRAEFTILFVLPALALFPVYEASAHSYLAYYSIDEYAAAQWINENLPEDAYLATDPGTGYFFRGLALRSASSHFILADGRAPWNGSSIYPNINELIHEAFREPDAARAREALASLGFSNLYVVVTTRTPDWVEDGAQVQWSHPATGRDPTVLAAFFAPPDFNLIFRSGDVYVFALGR